MLFYLDKKENSSIRQVKATTLAEQDFTEKDLENLISRNITRLIPENQLMILFQEWPFGESADINALDQNGDLYIFELKRWQSNKENILQVLRYGQIYGQYSYEQLEKLLSKYTKDHNDNLAEKHHDYFQESIDKPLDHSEFNRRQHFVVITNGVDIETLNAIKYWQEQGLIIESLPYKVYVIEGKPILEFNTYNPENEILIEREEGYFIVNTNITWMPNAYKEMLDNNKAAVYYDRKWSITNSSFAVAHPA